MSYGDIALATALVVVWNGYLIYKMNKNNE